MKIGILTQPLTTNYGGILQNFALQKVLSGLGHDVYTIDYGKSSWLGYIHNCVSFARIGFRGNRPETPIENRNKQRGFRQFIGKHIRTTVPRTGKIDWKLVDSLRFDAVIVGSDQVWRPCYNYDITAMFLKTIGGNIRKIAYAASFGTDVWEFTDLQTNECRELIKSFTGVSVREEDAVGMCKRHLDCDATWVLDPTLLLTKEDYQEVCIDVECKRPFVFAYILDESEKKVSEIKRFAAAKGLDYLIKSAGPKADAKDTIEEWLSYFRDAKYVITDSFHGTVFSILFNKDFMVYGNNKRGNSRFNSLLGLFSLQNRLTASIPNEWSAIDWNAVNCAHKSKKEESINWLMSISNCRNPTQIP